MCLRAVGSGVWFSHAFAFPNSSLQQTPVCAFVFVSALTAVRFKFGGQFEELVLMYQSLSGRGSRVPSSLWRLFLKPESPGAGARREAEKGLGGEGAR